MGLIAVRDASPGIVAQTRIRAPGFARAVVRPRGQGVSDAGSLCAFMCTSWNVNCLDRLEESNVGEAARRFQAGAAHRRGWAAVFAQSRPATCSTRT
jgi:hypothetical protein